MKIELVYNSKTGHSKKIAEAIEASEGIKVHALKDKPQLSAVNLLFIVSGVYRGKSDPTLIDYFQRVDYNQVRHAVIMTSSCGKESKQDDLREIIATNGIELEPEEFSCRGSFLWINRKHPNEEDLENAQDFVHRKIEEFVSQIRKKEEKN